MRFQTHLALFAALLSLAVVGVACQSLAGTPQAYPKDGNPGRATSQMETNLNNPSNLPSAPGDYERFFEAFGELPLEKQVAYVKFPLKEITEEMGDDGPPKILVYNNPPQFLGKYRKSPKSDKWILPSKKNIRENPYLKPRIKLISKHEADVTVWFRDECDFGEQYKFRYENGCWILVQINNW